MKKARRSAVKFATMGFLVMAVGPILYFGQFLVSYDSYLSPENPNAVTDVARLNETKVNRILHPTTVDEIAEALTIARKNKLKVAISGSRHSQGGQTTYRNALVLDMRGFNHVLNIDEKKKVIRVQSGATWNQIQRMIKPHHLAVKVMQSSYVFTVGGTLSANAHGRDVENTSVVETVISFRLLTADGKIRDVNRTRNAELFGLVIGGYGMFGVILDVEIQLTDDEVLERRAKVIAYQDLPVYFNQEIKKNPDVALLLVRPSIGSNTFLKELVVTTWNHTKQNAPAEIFELGEEKNVRRDRFLFGLSRKFQWGKDLRWYYQKQFESAPGETLLISRNNAMRPPATPLKFLDYYSASDTDLIQEYYVPIRNFVPFIDEFSAILQSRKTNVISFTIRYVKANAETYFPYSPREDCFAIIQMSNVGTSKEAQEVMAQTTQRLVDSALKHDGTYYLTYQSYPTLEQFRRAYPNYARVAERKTFYDPDHTFMSQFLEKYLFPTTPAADKSVSQ